MDNTLLSPRNSTSQATRQRQRTALLRSRLLAVAEEWLAKDGSTHLIARRTVDVTP